MNATDANLTAWTKADTMEYLARNPLPTDFRWRRGNFKDEAFDTLPLVAVQPTYAVADYGKWLHDTPYFQGLFELVHELIIAAGAKLPDIADLTRQLEAIRREREGQQKLF